MKNKAILINSLRNGGAERVVFNLINHIDAPDFHLLLLENVFFYKIKKICNLHVFNKTENYLLFKLFELPFLALKLNCYCKKNNIHIVQSHLPRSNYVNILAKFFGGNHQVQIVSHGIASLYEKKGIIGKVNLMLIKALYRKADFHITVSSGLQNNFKDLYKCKDNFITIHNPFPIEEIIQNSLKEVHDFKFLNNVFYFVFCGRLNSVKKIMQLVEWFSVISISTSEIALIIIGEGEEDIPLKKYINKNLINNIYLVGSKENPFSYIYNANCLLLNSEFEGFGNVIVEALLCKIPVVSVDCDYGPREILNLEEEEITIDGIKQNEYSILFESDNKAAFISAIKLLIYNYDSFKVGASNWAINHSNKFDSNLIAYKYIDILNSSLKSN